MKLAIGSTHLISAIDGVRVYLWRDRTEAGGRVRLFIHGVAAAHPDAQAGLDPLR